MLGRTEPSETMKYHDIRTDRSGGIEGLPLQLMIVILVATMGTAIIVGWMGNIEAPHAIGDVETPGPIIDASGGTVDGFYIEVRDQDGDYLEDAAVVFQDSYVWMEDADGNRTSASAVTDEFGRADFGTIHVDLREGTHTIEILVFKSDYGEKTVEVLVNV